MCEIGAPRLPVSAADIPVLPEKFPVLMSGEIRPKSAEISRSSEGEPPDKNENGRNSLYFPCYQGNLAEAVEVVTAHTTNPPLRPEIRDIAVSALPGACGALARGGRPPPFPGARSPSGVTFGATVANNTLCRFQTR